MQLSAVTCYVPNGTLQRHANRSTQGSNRNRINAAPHRDPVMLHHCSTQSIVVQDLVEDTHLVSLLYDFRDDIAVEFGVTLDRNIAVLSM